MSMIGNLRRLSDAKLTKLLADPSTIADYLYEEEGSPDGGDEEAFADLAIDKAWHAIHFLLNGSAWESRGKLGFLVADGRDVGDEDVGYGPARGFTSAEVREIARALEPFTGATLFARIDAAAMNAAEIYPQGWTDDLNGDPERVGYFVDYFDQMKGFIADAAKNGEALLVWLN